MLLPALAIVGLVSFCMETVALEAGQDPLLIVHWKIFNPKPKFVRPVFADVGEVIVPVPEISVQLPVPIAAALPAMIAVEAHTV